jgi:hypothetical protein
MTDSERSYWEGDEYLKRNAAGAHSGTNMILAKLEEFDTELAVLHSKMERIDRNCWAIGFGLLLVMWLTWRAG